MSVAEPDRSDPWTDGYRKGFVAGYEDGITDGRYQGYRDAKALAYQAMKDDLDARESLRAHLGEQ